MMTDWRFLGLVEGSKMTGQSVTKLVDETLLKYHPKRGTKPLQNSVEYVDPHGHVGYKIDKLAHACIFYTTSNSS